MEVFNRQAHHDYFIIEEYECGLALTGTEIKAIRLGNCNLKDSYAIIRHNELFVLNMYIAPYKEGNIFNHQERRTRKLLVHKKEIFKMRDSLELDGYTLIPLKLYLKNNKAKILLGVCKGKKEYDKRETIKQRDVKREIEKSIKSYKG